MRRMLGRASFLVRKDLNLGNVLERLAAVHGDRRLVTEARGGLALTHRQAAKRVARWAGGIAARTEPGDVVVVATPNGYHQLLLCLAVARAGCIPAPVNDAMRPDEVRHVMEDSGAAFALRSAHEVDGHEPVRQAVAASGSDVAALFYTSGTTGKPKGAALTHDALLGSLRAGALVPAGLRGDEAVVSLPVAHIMGFVTLLGLAATGTATWFSPRFRAEEILDAIESRRPSVFIGVPAMYRLLLEAGAEERDLGSIRVWGSGADVMPAELAQRFKKMGGTVRLPGVGDIGEAAFAEGYGLVETGGGVAAKISPPFMRLGTGDAMGFPVPGYRLRVVGDDGETVATGATGELLVKGPGVLRGYWHDEAATAAVLDDEGWLHTGDLARRGPLGSIVFAGRKKDVIMRGGFSVYAVEVEAVLEDHPDVLEAAVVPLPDDRLGEVPAAAVRLRDGVELDAAALDAHAREHLAHYKVPARYVAVDDLPRTGTNKVQRREVIALLA
ncbi:AMP-binding protein [Acidimicrobiia bacterium EGI L10123]|uniref:class I adenylate-forming enzyme family protein n=1 Tax=Salinilacustrithrix flava TaxID=2957203 RepID=UPI003D7C242F|nr:AMP-binding protein [Acidimicrobiia bacterium EGI L10123]